jgi:hypothetical protein
VKNIVKLLGIIAMAAVIGFSMAACGDDNNDPPGPGPGGGGSSSFEGTWTGTFDYASDELTATVVITGDSIKITANGKEFNGTLAAVTEKAIGSLKQYSRDITGKTGAGVSKWSDENTITLTFMEFSAPYTFEITGGLYVEGMTK